MFLNCPSKAHRLVHRFGWNRAALIYETQAYNSYVGGSGGFLLASTVHDYFISEGVSVLGREYFPTMTFEDILLQTVGNDYASKSVWTVVGLRF